MAKKPAPKPKPSYDHRSSETGRFVTKKYADKHPRTTERERRK